MEQCHKTTGHCVCVEGVAGPRCDTCARGYTGEFPDCIRCHECFAVWDQVVSDLTNRTQRLLKKVDTLKVSGVIGPYRDTIDNMEQSVGAIRAILAQNPATQPFTEIQKLLEESRFGTFEFEGSNQAVWYRQGSDNEKDVVHIEEELHTIDSAQGFHFATGFSLGQRQKLVNLSN